MQQLRLPALEEDDRFWKRGDLRRGARWCKIWGWPRRCPISSSPSTLEKGEEPMEGNVPVIPNTWDQGGGGHLDLR